MGCGSSKAAVVPVTIKENTTTGSSLQQALSPPTGQQSQGDAVNRTDDNTEVEDRPGSHPESRQTSKERLAPGTRGASDGESTSALAVSSPQEERSTSEEGIRKPVSFEVAFSGEATSKKPPRRLQKLESATTLTAKALEEKQRAADERKKQELDKKTKHLSKKERLRKEIRDAREFEKAQQQYTVIEQRLSSGDLNRAKVHEEIRDKQKKRDGHAKKVKARRGSASDSVGMESMSSTIEADPLYNAPTESIWDDTNNKGDDNPASTTAPADSNDHFFADDKIESGHNCSRHSSSEHVLVM